MLVACRLAGLSALEGHYADINARTQCGVEEQQGRRRPRLSEEMRRPVESCSDVILGWHDECVGRAGTTASRELRVGRAIRGRRRCGRCVLRCASRCMRRGAARSGDENG
jgi:hypothetical protein